MSDGEYTEVPVKVAEDGTFCDTLKFGTVYDCALFADKFMFRLCIEEGKHYDAVFDLTTGTETDFHFNGDGEKENLFLSHYWSSFRTMENIIRDLSGCDTFEAYMSGVDKVADALSAELGAIDNKPFVDYYRNEFTRIKTTYICLYPQIRVAKAGTYRPEKSYLEALKNAPKMDDNDFSYMLNSTYGYIPYMYPDIDLREALRAAADYTTDKIRRENAIGAFLNGCVDAGCSNNLEGAFEFYKENVKTPDPALCEKLENAMTLGPGSDAPDIEFEDIDGNVKHLADFQGKPLYIDLWASWCGPCCEEIPSLQKMVDALGEDPDIVCISISIDDERSNWTAKLAEENSTWPQYIATSAGMSAISNAYGVTGIPRFILLNSDGTLASVNAPRPSAPDAIETLKSLLK